MKRLSPFCRHAGPLHTPIRWCAVGAGVALLLFTLSACYSFKGTSISPDIQTFYVAPFDNRAPDAPPTLPVDFSEALRLKILNESRLTFNDENPDVEFTGAIITWRVSSEAPKPGELVAFNRLTIGVQVSYINHHDEQENWKSNFTYFADYDVTQNLLDVQDQLIEVISEELVNQIFNKAFTNW